MEVIRVKFRNEYLISSMFILLIYRDVYYKLYDSNSFNMKLKR